MSYELTQEQKEELEGIGELYRKTLYDSSIIYLPAIVNKFGKELLTNSGEVSSSITSEIFRFHKLISNDDYHNRMRIYIDKLRDFLSDNLPDDIMFTIICRQKSWESSLRKILDSYFNGESIILSDVFAFRIVIDAALSEDAQKEVCHTVCKLCIDFFEKNMCTLMPPAKLVANNPLFKDYINHPKPNGYQSIHLCFMDIDNFMFEIQIRTQAMHAQSENVLADEANENNNGKVFEHSIYKNNEYKQIIPYIYFDPFKASKPLFRAYHVLNPSTGDVETQIDDNIGLISAKPVEHRARTHPRR